MTGAGSPTAEEIVAAAMPLPDPTPLKPPRVPAVFPVDALPDWVGEYVAALAVATQTPPDLGGCCALGVLSACAGGRAVVEARPGWREPVNLYLLPVMPPGSRKSAVAAAAVHPLYLAERDLIEQSGPDRAEALILRDIAEKAAEKARRDAANAKDDATRKTRSADAVSAAKVAAEIGVPPQSRLIADDVTPEAVASLLAEHGGRMAIISAEGGIFDIIAGRYSSNVPNMDVWLKGHAGDQLRVDRKGRPPEHIEAPALTMMLTVQPAVLAAIAWHGVFRGRGLTARVLYSIPTDNVGRRTIGAPSLPAAVASTYETKVRRLAKAMAGWTDPAVLTLTPEAHELLLGLERAIEPRLTRDGEYGPIREWASKLVGAILRIAGLLHLAAGEAAIRTPVSVDTLRAAARFGGYFVEHAQTAFDLLGDGGTSDAAYLLGYLRRRTINQFTVRSLLTDLPRGRFASAGEVGSAVDVLTEHGWVVALPPPPRTGAGRPPSLGYRTHPAVFTDVEVSAISAQSAEPPSETNAAGQRPVTGAEPVSAESTRDSAESPPEPAGRRRRDSAESVTNSAESPDRAPTWANTHSADCADIAETSAPPHCLGCGKPLPIGSVGCTGCYAAGRIDDDGRATA